MVYTGKEIELEKLLIPMFMCIKYRDAMMTKTLTREYAQIN